ncbi:MAG TPA: IclR family transcriptional regulator [Rectinemataceae bacterium]
MKEEYTLIQSVDRALSLLEYIAAHPEKKLTLTELAEVMDLDKSSVFRILTTLGKHGLVRQEEGKKVYRPGFGIFGLASSLYEQMKLPEITSPFLRDIARKTSENAHLAVRSGTQAVFIDREQGTNRILTNTNIGDTEELYCTAVGKCLICDCSSEELESLFGGRKLERFTERTLTDIDALRRELEDVKRKGYAVDIEEYEPNVVCLACPIMNYQGRIIAAIGISGTKDRGLPDLERNIGIVMQAASAINGLLSGTEAKD